MKKFSSTLLAMLICCLVSFGSSASLNASILTISDVNAPYPGCDDPAAANYDSMATSNDGSCLYNATFNVDMNCESGFTNVNISGPFVGWCDNCLPLTDMGGGIWSGTFQLPALPFEYKYQVDDFAFQENLVDDMVGGATCAPVTDFSSYANRLVDITADVVFDDTYGTCGSCVPGAGCIDSGANNYDSTASVDDGSCMYDVTFNVDMNCESGFSNVNVTGPFVGWCANCLPLADGDGDGIWSGTFSLPSMMFEYKYNTNDFALQEDLIDDMIAGATCAPITDFATYANREILVEGGAIANDTYGSCSACIPDGSGCTDIDAVNYDSTAFPDDGSCLYNVEFVVDMNCLTDGFTTVGVTSNYVGWCANCLPLSDLGGGIWGGIYAFPAGPIEFLYNVDGPPGQENLIDDMIAGGTCAPVTDFATYANREVIVAGPLTVTIGTYGQCITCVPGANGCTDSGAINFDSLASVDDGSCLYDVVFNVDMNCELGFSNVNVTGPFVGWCANCLPLTDIGGGIWSGTFQLPGGPFEYKYNTDDFAFQEDLVDDMVGGASCAPITDFATFANREIIIGAGTIADDTYGTCGVCSGDINGCTDSAAVNFNSLATIDDGTCQYEVTFNVNMNCEFGFSNVNVTGPFVGWCANCLPLADGDGDGIWSGTFVLPAGPFEYKYNTDDFAFQEDLVDDMIGGASCAPITDFATYANREIIIGAGTVADDTYGTCGICAVLGCTYAQADNYDPAANDDDGSCLFSCCDATCAGDTDGNNIVNILDLVAVSSNFGNTCP